MPLPTQQVSNPVGKVNTLQDAGQHTMVESHPVVLASDQSPVSTKSANPPNILTGQVKILTTGTAVQLPYFLLVNGVVLRAKFSNNAVAAMVGSEFVTNFYNGSGNGYPLLPGEAISFAVENMNAIWITGTAGDIFSYAGN